MSLVYYGVLGRKCLYFVGLIIKVVCLTLGYRFNWLKNYAKLNETDKFWQTLSV